MSQSSARDLTRRSGLWTRARRGGRTQISDIGCWVKSLQTNQLGESGATEGRARKCVGRLRRGPLSPSLSIAHLPPETAARQRGFLAYSNGLKFDLGKDRQGIGLRLPQTWKLGAGSAGLLGVGQRHVQAGAPMASYSKGDALGIVLIDPRLCNFLGREDLPCKSENA